MAEGSEEDKMIIGRVRSRGFWGMGVMGKRKGRVPVPKAGVTEVSSAEKSIEETVAAVPEEHPVEGVGEAKPKRKGRRKRKTEEQDG